MGKIAAVILLLFLSTSVTYAEKDSIEKIIPITAANLRGHKALYQKGWFFVSSTQKAFHYSTERFESAGEALERVLNSIPKNAKELPSSFEDHLDSSAETTSTIFKKGTANSKEMLIGSHKLATKLIGTSKSNLSKAHEKFVLGHLSIKHSLKDELDSIAAYNKQIGKELKEGYRNSDNTIESILNRIGGLSIPKYNEYFAKGKEEFSKEYERSGKHSNSFTALGPILWGYVKAGYYFIFPPAVQSTRYIANNTTKLILSPISKSIITGEKACYALGNSLYHVGRMGWTIISPTAEAGLLSSLAVLSTAGAGMSYLGGGTLGAINQVATTAVAPISGAGQLTLSTTYSLAKFATVTSYDIGKNVVSSAANIGLAGIVLGYNALTATPTHLLLGAANSIFFVSWDGPRLILYALKNSSLDLSKLKSGTILDVSKIKEQFPSSLIEVSDDQNILNNVIKGAVRD